MAQCSSFILSAESLLGAGYAKEVERQTFLGQTRERTLSGAYVHLLRGTTFALPLNEVRVGVDGVLGGATLGLAFGYDSYDPDATVTGGGTSASVGIRSLAVVPRLGYMISASQFVSFWVRAGFGYFSFRTEIDGKGTGLDLYDLVLDPMLTITPLPHVALFVGPSLMVGLGGGVTDDDAPERDIGSKYSSYGFSSGLGLIF